MRLLPQCFQLKENVRFLMSPGTALGLSSEEAPARLVASMCHAGFLLAQALGLREIMVTLGIKVRNQQPAKALIHILWDPLF